MYPFVPCLLNNIAKSIYKPVDTMCVVLWLYHTHPKSCASFSPISYQRYSMLFCKSFHVAIFSTEAVHQVHVKLRFECQNSCVVVWCVEKYQYA